MAGHREAHFDDFPELVLRALAMQPDVNTLRPSRDPDLPQQLDPCHRGSLAR